jgi:hypothetical protein
MNQSHDTGVQSEPSLVLPSEAISDGGSAAPTMFANPDASGVVPVPIENISREALSTLPPNQITPRITTTTSMLPSSNARPPIWIDLLIGLGVALLIVLIGKRMA